MNSITKLMVDKFKILEIGIDFMGYRVTREKSLSFHHLVVPKKSGGKEKPENGAILVRESSHNYLHIIEKIDRHYFNFVTQEMIKENKQGYIDMENIKKIDEILQEFEKKYIYRKRKIVSQDIYLRRLLREMD